MTQISLALTLQDDEAEPTTYSTRAVSVPDTHDWADVARAQFDLLLARAQVGRGERANLLRGT